jgi:Condensation domain
MNSLSPPSAMIRRPLGSAGHMFWLMNQNSPVHFSVCAQVKGQTTLEDWRKALDMMQARHPNFGVRIALDEAAEPYFQPVPAARIPLRIVANGGLGWEPEIERELATPFDAQRAPLVRAVLLHQANRAVLILSAHHSIADGKSLVFAIRDTLYAVSGKLLEPPGTIVSLDDWFAALPKPIEDIVSGQSEDPQPLAQKSFAFRRHDGSAPRVMRHTLALSLTDALRRRSRKEQATIQCALVTAAVEAARQISNELEGATVRVSSPIDFRKVVGAADEVAPLGTGVMVPMAPQAHKTFWDAARFAKSVIDPARTPGALAKAMGQIGPFMSNRPGVADVAGFWSQQLGYDINVSNLGDVPIENRIGGLTLEALGGPSILIGFEGEQGIGVATANGSLTLLHASYKPLPSLLESMEQILIAACS